MLTLRNLMLLLSIFTPLLFTIADGWTYGRGLGILFGAFLGFALSTVCVIGTATLFKWAGRHPKLSETNISTCWVIVLFGLVIWIFGVAILGSKITEKILHHHISKHSSRDHRYMAVG